MPGGRPTKYKPEYCQMVIDHMSQGFSFETFAAVIDVNQDTLYEWRQKQEEFSEAVKKAFLKCQIYWEKIGADGANGKIHNFSAASYIFNMKNRFKWSDRQDITVDASTNITFKNNEEIIGLILEARQEKFKTVNNDKELPAGEEENGAEIYVPGKTEDPAGTDNKAVEKEAEKEE